MDQLKIGKFIAECRKQKQLTQLQLADKLGITDKAISKWERGIAMPDSSIMLELCDILGISVNELLNG
jgi:transcriptional regulator with XRE-family HTH domain